MTEQRRLAYGIGIEHEPGSFGMTDGPFFELKVALETVPFPSEDRKSCIIQFNKDGTDSVLYRWKTDSWIRQPTLKRSRI